MKPTDADDWDIMGNLREGFQVVWLNSLGFEVGHSARFTDYSTAYEHVRAEYAGQP